jgi:CubicO group peptidase (beta-lactamase class C family)
MLDQLAINQLKAALRKGIENNEVAGANMMVVYKGEEIFYHEDGLADIDAGAPIKRDSIFRLYSMTKPVTATAVMMLLERGEIDLFDPVSKFLPGFKDQKIVEGDKLVPAKREVNLQDLLNMTSGLVYPGWGNQAERETNELFQELDRRLLSDSPMTTIELANRLGQAPIAFQPGSAWQYGTNTDVLGAVVEVVSGMRFGQFLQQQIFEPLGMNDTGFWVPEEKRSRLAKTYGDDGNGGLTLYAGHHLGINHQLDRDPGFESGGAGLASTIEDCAKFTTMLMNEGSLNGVQILRPRTVRYLRSSTLTDEQQQCFDGWHGLRGHSYGNMMRVITDFGKAGVIGSPGEYGWDGWLGAFFTNCPADDLTFLFMIQKKDAGTLPLTRKLRNIVVSSF